jgi:hypothetical protein
MPSTDAFDRDGMRVFGINLYALVPSARTISIYDAAVRRNEAIASQL